MYPWFKVSFEQLQFPSLSPVSLKVYIALAAHQSEEGYTTSSYNTLARRCGLSRRAVIDHVRDLEVLGLVERTHKRSARDPLTVRILRGSSVGDTLPGRYPFCDPE